MPSFTWRKAGLAGIAALAVGAVGAGLLAGRNAVDPPKVLASADSRTAPAEPAAPAGPAAGDLVELRHEEAGFALSYPKGWLRPAAADAQVAFIAAEHEPAENRGGSILVRVTPLEAAIDRSRLAEARQATDAIVAAEQEVKLEAQPLEITQGGLPGFYYLYTFSDPVSGQRGAHSHYFLFRDRVMVSMVFQVLPVGDFARLAPVFDRVAESFRVLGPGS